VTPPRILKLKPQQSRTWPIEEIAAVLEMGGLIAYPTETIYGLGVDALNEEAIRRLVDTKSRRPEKPISILVRDMDMLRRVVSHIPSIAVPIIEKHWPGPVTVVFPVAREISPILTGQTGTLGVRISPHPFVKSLFRAFDSPITSTSANLSGGRSLIEPEDILRSFGGSIDLVVDMAGSMGGAASTVVDVTGKNPRVLRRGVVDLWDSG
jgi:L-threonylcarbamoyladenylate synthase